MSSTSVEVARPAAAPVSRRFSPGLLLSIVGLVSVAAGTLAVLSLHVVQPTASTSALRRTISEYAYSTLGWVFNAGVLAVSAGSLLIAASLWWTTTLRRVSAGSLTLVAWSISLVVLTVFPKHDWSVGPSTHGTVHRVASLIAFISVPIAAIVIGRRRSGRLRTPARFAILFGAIEAGWLGLLLAGFILGPLTRTPWWQVFPLGLMERGMASFAIAGVLSLGWLALRAARVTNPAAAN